MRPIVDWRFNLTVSGKHLPHQVASTENRTRRDRDSLVPFPGRPQRNRAADESEILIIAEETNRLSVAATTEKIEQIRGSILNKLEDAIHLL